MTKLELLYKLDDIRNTGNKIEITNELGNTYKITASHEDVGGFDSEFYIEHNELGGSERWITFDDALEFLMSDHDIKNYS